MQKSRFPSLTSKCNTIEKQKINHCFIREVFTDNFEFQTNRMREYKVKAFGVVKDILGGKETCVQLSGQTVAALRTTLVSKYPALVGLRSLLIAVNNTYADDDVVLKENDEIALIPPVSGG